MPTIAMTTNVLDNNNSSSSSSNTIADRINATKQSLQAWRVQKESLELEGQAILSELTTSPGVDEKTGSTIPPAGIDDPLVDSEGYPRNDLDIYRVRTIRNRLACIKTDLEKLEREMETNLEQLAHLQNSEKATERQEEYASRMRPKPKPKFDPVSGKWVVSSWDGSIVGHGAVGGAVRKFDGVGNTTATTTAAAEGGESATTLNTAITPVSSTIAATATEAIGMPPVADRQEREEPRAETEIPTNLKPFARVTTVDAGNGDRSDYYDQNHHHHNESPASAAGLLPGDLVLAVADIDATTDNWKQELARLIPGAASRQESVSMIVLRNQSDRITISLKPRPWSGRGLLGCHIVPYECE